MSEVTEIKTLNGYPLADTKARADIAALTEEFEQLKESGGAGVAVDETLTESGKAADAAVVGAKFDKLTKDVEDIKLGSDENVDTIKINVKQIYNPATGKFTANNARLSNSPPVQLNGGDVLYVNIADGEQAIVQLVQKVGTSGVLDDDYEYITTINWTTENIVYGSAISQYAVVIVGFVDGRKVSPGDISSTAYIERAEQVEVLAGYSTQYTAEEDSLAQKVLRDRDVNTITFAVITDTHYGGTGADRQTLPQVKAVNEMALRLGAKFVAHLGDAIHGGHSTLDENEKYLAEFWRVQNDTPMPVLYTLAHHEMYGSGGASNFGNDDTAISLSDSLGMYGRTHRHLPVVYSSDKANWYVDIDGVRFIGLSCVTENSPGKYSDVAVDFLNTALSGDDPVVVFSHTPCRATVSYGNSGVTNGGAVESALNAYEGGVLAYIHGHTHWDNIFKPDDGTFPFWSVCCAMISKMDIETYGCSEGNPVSYDRTAGTYSEYCFDIINIHPDTGVIRSFRFGAGADREYTPTT